MQTLKDILNFQSIDVRASVEVIRTINGGSVTYSQLKCCNKFADGNQNCVCKCVCSKKYEELVVQFVEVSGAF